MKNNFLKLNLLIACFLLVTSGIFAQEKQDTLKPLKGDWGFVLNLTGLVDNISLGTRSDINNNNTVLAKYQLKDNRALRIGLGLYSKRENNFAADSISLLSGNRAWREVDSVETRFDFSVALGYELHFEGTRRLMPYVGGELVVGRIGNTKIDATTEITDKLGTQRIKRIIQQDGGMSFGVNVLAGFNYFFAEHISIGAEFNLGYFTRVQGGDQSESVVDTPVSGQQSSTFAKTKGGTSNRGFDVNSTAGLLLSFYF